MPKVTKLNRTEKIAKYKSKAPTYVGPTCKYIDHIQNVIDEELKPLIAEKDEDFFYQITKQINAQLEFIRASNETLRDSSKYWYESFKKEI
jgi:hypothetical protein